MTTTQEPQVQTSQTTTKPDFGNGRFSQQMESIYTDCQKLFGIEPAKAEKIARMAGSDAGAVFRNANATIKVGSMNKDGKATIADASKVKGVTMTMPLSIVRAIQWVADAGKNGISYGHTKWQLSPLIAEWVEGLKA
jgi:hypothetical protein